MSACAPSDRLLQTLTVEVPGATPALLSLQLFNTIDEFLRRTSAWQYRQSVPLQVGVDEYALEIPADATIVRVMAATYNSMPMAAAPTAAAATASEVGRLAPEQVFADGDASFKPVLHDISPVNSLFTYAIYRPDYLTITGVQQPTDQPVELVTALSIARHCLEQDCGDWQLEPWMYDMFFQDWLDGTKWKLFSMPAKPWTSKELMIYHGKRFRNAMAYRKQEALRGFSYDTPVWRYPGGW